MLEDNGGTPLGCLSSVLQDPTLTTVMIRIDVTQIQSTPERILSEREQRR